MGLKGLPEPTIEYLEAFMEKYGPIGTPVSAAPAVALAATTTRHEAAMKAAVAHLWQRRYGAPMTDDDWAEIRLQYANCSLGCEWVDEMDAAALALNAADAVATSVAIPTPPSSPVTR